MFYGLTLVLTFPGSFFQWNNLLGLNVSLCINWLVKTKNKSKKHNIRVESFNQTSLLVAMMYVVYNLCLLYILTGVEVIVITSD